MVRPYVIGTGESLQAPEVVDEAMGTLVQAHFHGGVAR